jgi:hypothetical protein
VAISGLTVADGFTTAPGGGIFNAGVLTVTDSTVSRNSPGGIYNDGTLALITSTISGNSAGGITNNTGSLTMNNSAVSANGERARATT